MRIPDSIVEKLLKSTEKISEEQISSLRAQEKSTQKSLQELAITNNLLTEAELTKFYAAEVDVPYADLNPHEIDSEVLRLIPERIAHQYRVVVFANAPDGSKKLAIEDPNNIQAVNFLRKTLGPNMQLHVATSSAIEAALGLYRGNISSELIKVITSDEPAEQIEEEVSEADVAEDSPIAQTVNLIIEEAVKSGASDIHIEPRDSYVAIRYRIDGMLHEANKLPKKVLGALVSRIKILSNLKIDEHRAPQDGRFKVSIGAQVFAMRVSTLPIADGEKVAIHIFNESATPATLEQLGYWGSTLKIVNKAIIQPHGMVLVTGPTGSGKSTSLFSVLSLLNKPTINISTIEDPVEYRIPGTNQTQVNPATHMTFANGLRALLRQDPNIIMVGEIRDSETANLAVQAALTGHLVFSTLHTNNAATGLPRLLDMGVEAFLIASTVRAVIGQRLVRKLCIFCRESYQPSSDLLAEINESFLSKDITSSKAVHQLEVQAQTAELGSTTDSETPNVPLGSTETAITTLWRARKEGCDKCNHSGYKGRIGIYEVLDNSASMQKLIVGSHTTDEIQTQAVSGGMIPMQIDGLIKALRGMTTIEEILRVTTET